MMEAPASHDSAVQRARSRFGEKPRPPPTPSSSDETAGSARSSPSQHSTANVAPRASALCLPPQPVSVPPSQQLGAKIPVSLSVRVRRTFDLDNVKQTFGCNLHIIMSWGADNETAPEERQGAASAGFDWTPEWKPRFVIKNVMELVHSTEFYTIRPNPNAHLKGEKKAIILGEMRLLVKIFHDMDLREFPFDIQRFVIEMEMEGIDSDDAKFVPFPDLPGADCIHSRCIFEDMKLAADKERALEYSFYSTKRSSSRLGMSLSGLKIKMTFCRRSNYYISNVALIMCVICSFALTAWASDDVADRQAVDFTLLLTAVAFKLVVVSMLPPVAYHTYLDYYVFFCMLFLSLVSITHSITPWLQLNFGDQFDGSFDDRCFIFFALSWIIFNVICGVWASNHSASTLTPFSSGRILADRDMQASSAAGAGESRTQSNNVRDTALHHPCIGNTDLSA
ncbi:hypothetical protein AB1Y20_007913 [Prymnesium parvum]|uniref:Neurotransmitter-gated ion-channel ligand-binding domain-containing protein n=1 Tax=Prymnesium parvum TaxID=97485 RepID=A0AB34IV31_PRYPA